MLKLCKSAVIVAITLWRQAGAMEGNLVVSVWCVQDFAWSPAEPILCAYQAEQSGGNLPARISLVRVPDRTELRQKNLFSVSGAQPTLLFVGL